jgi:mono/diheme cytochrome c family protein
MKQVIALLVALWVAGCAPNSSRIPEPTEQMALGLGVEQAALTRGHATYLSQCSRCHERVPPGKVDPEFWRGIVSHMAVKAQISKVEEHELLLYLMAAHGTVHGLDLQH